MSANGRNQKLFTIPDATGAVHDVVYEDEDDEPTDPGRSTRVTLKGLLSAIRDLTDNIGGLKTSMQVQAGNLAVLNGAVNRTNRIVKWIAISAGALVVVGLLLWWSRPK